MKKGIKNIVLWSIILFYLAIVFGFVDNKKASFRCNDVEVVITDSLQNNFVTRDDIFMILEREEMKLLGYPINDINTRELEEVIQNHPPIDHVEAYAKINGVLTIELTQRKPIVRIIDNKGKSFYIDKKGAVLPFSHSYSSHVLIANGNIKHNLRIVNARSVLDSSQNNMNGKPAEDDRNILKELYFLAYHIYHNEFWKNQIVQIYVNEDMEYELIPRVGAQIIYLGGMSDYKGKLRRLKIFYNKGLNNIGWNDYEKINLKYANQIICTKR